MKIHKLEARMHRPVRVTAMTTAAPNVLRQWYTRGHLGWDTSPVGGLDTWHAAEVAVRAWLSQLGYPPKHSRELGVEAARHMLFFAVLETTASLQVHGTREQKKEFFKSHSEDGGLARKIVGLHEGAIFSSIVMRDDEPEPNMIDHTIDSAVTEGCIAIRGISLLELGCHFAEAAKQPLFDVYLDPFLPIDTNN